jgi:hypothetical protein
MIDFSADPSGTCRRLRISDYLGVRRGICAGAVVLAAGGFAMAWLFAGAGTGTGTGRAPNMRTTEGGQSLTAIGSSICTAADASRGLGE